jgi:hypothetical protein
VRTAALVVVLLLTSAAPAAPAGAGTAFLVLQMNLCDSGRASWCYSFGRAVDEAVAKIRRYSPDLVTLQEICSGDVSGPAVSGPAVSGRLARAMAGPDGRDPVSVAFVPAFDRDAGGWYRCTRGDLFGIAVLHRGSGRGSHSGWYASQDSTEEVRAWTCATVVAGRVTGCTTHLSTDPDVAVRQCRELRAVLTAPWATPEVVVAGDFNLTSAPGRPGTVQGCAPAGYDRRGDGAVQHILFTRTMRAVRGRSEDLRGTDHPLLYELFRV